RLPVSILHGEGSDAQLRPEIADACRDGLDVGQVADGNGVIVSEFLARAHFLGGAAKGKGLDVESKDYVGTDAADDLADVLIKPAPNRGHADQHADSQDYREHSQRRAKFIAADRVRRHANDFAEFVFAYHKRAGCR